MLVPETESWCCATRYTYSIITIIMLHLTLENFFSFRSISRQQWVPQKSTNRRRYQLEL